eukprot:CAMPEP_0197528468 /NCGR_PEP_ID=MMETSP1318-20131121/25209_1 /TAXON_ID=552666 /ORGANISM="Partenskyella glossopodia, Strain RCC365" /LENGTH=141 /DNA_ID=CAMNT_0043083587 /DNA_START=145 /DNA_END=567 /DNA_ORIENTATION=-
MGTYGESPLYSNSSSTCGIRATTRGGEGGRFEPTTFPLLLAVNLTLFVPRESPGDSPLDVAECRTVLVIGTILAACTIQVQSDKHRPRSFAFAGAARPPSIRAVVEGENSCPAKRGWTARKKSPCPSSTLPAAFAAFAAFA